MGRGLGKEGVARCLADINFRDGHDLHLDDEARARVHGWTRASPPRPQDRTCTGWGRLVLLQHYPKVPM
jgi:hypothetical protein